MQRSDTSTPGRVHPIIPLLVILTIVYSVAFVGSQGTMQGMGPGGWYESLTKPSFTPPSWLFAPVWTILYGLMGCAAWLVWREPSSRHRSVALMFFGFQLILNGLWSWLFFAWHLLPLAFADIILMALMILGTMITFARVNRAAAWMLLPYLAWVSFAAVLNYSIWQLNPPTTSELGNPLPPT